MSNKSEGKEFAGFSIPEKNYFPMPNNWTNICAEIDNLSELKVIQYVIRHTWGYQEYGGYKTISVDEFMHGRRRQDRTRMDNGTGLSEPSVKDGLKRAIKHGYLVCITDDKDKGRTKKSYGLKMYEASHERGKNLGGQDSYPVSNLPPEVKNLTPRGKESYPRTEKDTIERHLEKNKESVSVAPTSETLAHEDTHTSFINSSSEQVAETTATTQQARSRADSATSAPSPRASSFPLSPHDARGDFPPDTNRVEPPVAENKAQVNAQTYPWMTMLDQWDKDYNGGRRSKRDSLTLRLAREWMVEMNLTYQDAQTVRRKIIENNLHRGKPITFTMVYDHSQWLGEIPEAPVHQNGQGKHATSTPLDTERNERNLQNLLKRAAEKRAAQATTE